MSVVPSDLVRGRGAVPYNKSIIGGYFFYKNRIVRACRLQGGADQVAVMDVDTGESRGYPSVGMLVPAVHPDKAEDCAYPTETNLLSDRCEKLENEISELKAQCRDLLTKYDELLSLLKR